MKNITLWNGKSVPRMGIGTWVMGGEQYANGSPTGWSNVDDTTSVNTLLTAFEKGVRIIDTSDQYGGGHAEKVIAHALKCSTVNRDDVVICTKVGNVCDRVTGNIVGTTDKKEEIALAIDASLKRLNTDYLDLVKFHLNRHPVEQSHGAFEAFSNAYQAGKILGFGWSNDSLEGAVAFADRQGFVAVQHDLNLFAPADALLRALEKRSLWSFNRQPLAMGVLTGKYHNSCEQASANDVRSSGFEWLRYFDRNGKASVELVESVENIRTLLTHDGRTLAQGALGWCLAQSDRAIPLPGCRTPEQAADNFGVLDLKPMSAQIATEISRLVSDLQVPVQ